MSWKIPLFKIHWDMDDVEAVTNVVRRGSYWATGPEIAEFEGRIADYVGTKYAAAFNSGTSALHALFMAYGIGPGDEVIVPSFTFISTANSPLFVGAKPVLADIEEETLGLDPIDVTERITRNTKAIMPVHYAGGPCNIKALKEVADDAGAVLIEDAAESLGAKLEGKMVGSFGDAAMFSFCQNKVLSTGEGGMIVTDSKEIYEKLKLIRSHGRADSADYFSTSEKLDYITMGYNFRMPTLIAALGISQFQKMEIMIQMRRKNAELYTSGLKELKDIYPPMEPENTLHVYQMYTMSIENGLRDKVKAHLDEKGVLSKVYFDPVHLTGFYRKRFGYDEGLLPKTEEMGNRVLTLPMYPDLTEDEINYVVESVKGAVE